MSGIIIDNELLKNEIKALNNYTNRDEYNLNVVEVMINEIRDIIKGLKPCEKETVDKGIVDYYLSKVSEKCQCPYCGSENVKSMYGRVNLDGSNQRMHYICEDCQKEFDAN